jgi:putative Mg2+ transporter-C (MgtC) family protein
VFWFGWFITINPPIIMNVLDWATHTLRDRISSPWLDLILVLAAMVCGAILGVEREKHDKPAGLRTLVLVCLGSALFTMVSSNS